MDWYNGGMEHTTLHLLYSRFWHKFLYDIGVVPTSEPYRKRTSHGLVLGENGEKMSKSRGNVVNPDEMVEKFGADAFRLYEMFMGAFDQPIPWSTSGLNGMSRFLYRVWELQDKVAADAHSRRSGADTARLLHQTIKQVGERVEAMKFNTAIAALMTLANQFGSQERIRKDHWQTFLTLLAPFAPHICEELWQTLGHDRSLAHEPWPQVRSGHAAGRRDRTPRPGQRQAPLQGARAGRRRPRGKSGRSPWPTSARKISLAGKPVKKVIIVPGRMVNIVTG